MSISGEGLMARTSASFDEMAQILSEDYAGVLQENAELKRQRFDADCRANEQANKIVALDIELEKSRHNSAFFCSVASIEFLILMVFFIWFAVSR
jgi:hypothetical protein